MVPARRPAPVGTPAPPTAGPASRVALWLRCILWPALAVAVLGLPSSASPTRRSAARPMTLRPQASVICLRRRQDELQRISQINRESKSTSPTCPSTSARAMLAAEDRGFYQENGVSPRACSGRSSSRSGVAGPPRVAPRSPSSTSRTTSCPRTARSPASTRRSCSRSKIDQRQSKQQILEELPQHHLPRTRRLRHRDRGPGLPRQSAKDLTVEESAVRLGHPRSLDLRPPWSPRTSRTSRPAGTTSSTAWSARAGSTRPPVRPQFPTPSSGSRPTATGTNGYLVQPHQVRAQGQTPALRRRPRPRWPPGGPPSRSVRQDAAVAAVQESMPADAPTFASVWPRSSRQRGGGRPYGGATYATDLGSTGHRRQDAGGSTFAVHLIAALKEGTRSTSATPTTGRARSTSTSSRTLPPDKPFSQRGGVRNRQHRLRHDRRLDGDRELGQHRLRPAQHPGHAQGDRRGGQRRRA